MHSAHANSKRRNSSHWNCRRGLQTHGGLTPAALGCVDDTRRTLRHSPRTGRVMRTTAGLRPPLLVTCVRASQTSFFRRQTLARQHKSGGRQPPVECTQRTRTRSAEIRRIGIADGVYKPTAGLHPPLLVLCVSASQTSFFRRQTSAHQHKSGGRQPPVALINANATAIRTHTVGGLPTNGARVCRCVFAHPRRANAHRSWYCAFVHRKHRFFRRQTSAHQHKSGGRQPPVAGHCPRHNEPAEHKRRWQSHPHIRLGKSGHSTPTAASRAAQVETT
jgi:hypothetical protein